MGGVLILGAMTISTLLWADLGNGLVWLVTGVTLFFGLIGSVDDLKKIRKQNSRGLSARGKIVLQIDGVKEADLGTYECKATNEQGEQTCSAQLMITGK